MILGALEMLALLLVGPGLFAVAMTIASRYGSCGWADRLASWAFGAVGLAFLGLVTFVLMRVLGPVGLLLGLTVGSLVFWFREFTLLMQLPDEAFPGRNDKLIWALLMIVMPPVGLLASWSRRRSHGVAAPAEKPEPVAGLRDFA